MTEQKKSGKWRSWVLLGALVLVVAAGGALLVYSRTRPQHVVHLQRGQINLRAGNVQAAVQEFRSALEEQHDLLPAQLELVRALTMIRKFEEAEKELEKAREMGLAEPDLAERRARIYAGRGRYRLQTAGEAVDVKLCDDVIAEDLDPAIELVEENAENCEHPGRSTSRLGKLLMQKSHILVVKWQLLRKKRELAENLEDKEEMAARNAAAVAVMAEMGRAQRAAVAAYERTVELNPELFSPRLAIAGQAVARFQPAPQRARDILQPVLEAEPEHLEAHRILAEAERVAGNYEKALEHIHAVEGKSEGEQTEFGLMVLRARILVDAERWEEADVVTEKLIALRPHHRIAAYLRGRALLQQEKYAEAAGRLQSIFAHSDQRWAQARFALAQALEGAGNRHQAISAYEQVLRDASEATPQNIQSRKEILEAVYATGLTLYEKLKGTIPDVAAEYARKALGTFPHREEAYRAARKAWVSLPPAEREAANPALLHAAALALVRKPQKALKVCEQGLKDAMDEAETRQLHFLRARILVTNGMYKEAISAYEELQAPRQLSWASYELASLHARLGHTEPAREIYKDLLRANPSDRRALAGLLRVLLRTGDIDGARAVLENLQRETDSRGIRALLMDLYARSGQTDEALELARGFAESQPDSATAQAWLGRLLWRADKPDQAWAAFEEALKADPEYPGGYSRGLIDLQQGRTAEALELFRKAESIFSGPRAPKVELALSLQLDGRTSEAREMLRKLHRTGGQNSALLAWHLGLLCAAEGDIEKAQEYAGGVVLAQLGLGTDQAKLLRNVAGLEPPARDGAASAIGLALVIQRSGNPDAALSVLRKAEEHLPGDPVLTCWRLGILDARGSHQEAVTGYQEVIEANPEFLFARIKLARSHAQHEDLPAAVSVLEEALAHAPEHQGAIIHFHLAGLYQRLQRFDQALASYRTALEYPPRAAAAYNNIAWIMAVRKGETEKALPLAQKALELASSSPHILDTVGWIHLLRGSLDEAIEHLEKARRGLPHVPTVRAHLGLAYLKAGRKQEAAAELRQALTISTDFPEADDAREALRSL